LHILLKYAKSELSLFKIVSFKTSFIVKSVSFKIIIQNKNKHAITVRFRTNLDRTGTEQAQNEQGTRTGARSLSLNFLSVLVPF